MKKSRFEHRREILRQFSIELFLEMSEYLISKPSLAFCLGINKFRKGDKGLMHDAFYITFAP